MESEKITINNRLSMQAKQLESIENERLDMLNERDELAAAKSNETTETGKILMTINNLEIKCSAKRPEMILFK